MDLSLNALWCRCIVEELVRGGCRHAVLCPGHRNLPLLAALDRQPGLRCVLHAEERSAAFAALGMARASRQPVAVATTSGSAVANLMPALVEAFHAGIPLLLLTADRPARFQDCGAPQTMRQHGIFSHFLVGESQLGDPRPTSEALRQCRHGVASLLRQASSGPGGPVQINVPLDEPLDMTLDRSFQAPSDDGGGEQQARGFSTIARSIAVPPLAGELRPGMRGLIVVGGNCPLPAPLVSELATATGFPVLADAASGLRYPAVTQLIAAGEVLVTGPLGSEQPELLIRLGPTPLARPLWEWCQQQDCPVLRIDRWPVERDHLHRRFSTLVRPGPAELASLARTLAPGDADWGERWRQADVLAQRQRQTWLQQAAWGECRAAAQVLTAAAERCHLLHCSNSMPVRHANLQLPGASCGPVVTANRGLNGIDGQLATFLGAMLAEPARRGLLLIGDTAFMHDLPALALASGRRLRACIAVLVNGGGAIFDLLPGGRDPALRHMLRCEQALDLAAAARCFGLGHLRAEDGASLGQALDHALAADVAMLLEIRVPPDSLAEQWPALSQAMTASTVQDKPARNP